MSTITNIPGQMKFGNAGDTIEFEGTHVLSNVMWPGDRVYTSSPNGAKITGGNEWTVKFNNVANVSIKNLLFDNGNLLIENCRNFFVSTPFRNLVGRGAEKSHAIRLVRPVGCTVVGDFKDMLKADTCIEGFDPVNCKFSDGRFISTHEPIHFWWFSYDISKLTDCYFERNIIEGVRRHGIELQGGPNGCFVRRNHISKRLANGIGLSIATGLGLNGAGGYESTARIEVDDNVIDNTGFPMPDPSQCMGIEAMGRIKVRNNYIVNGGQGIAVTQNSPDTVISGNRFKGMPAHLCIVSDPPREKYIQPKPENFTGNDKAYIGAVPTAAEITGATPVPPPPPPPPPTMPQITAPVIDRLEIGKTYTATGTGIGALKWFIDRIGDGKDAFATGDGASISFTVPSSFQNIDTTELHKIEIALLDSSNARVTKTYAIVKPIVAPPPVTSTVLTGTPYSIRVPELNGVPDFTKATKV